MPPADRILSDFIDAWNAGRRPDPDEHLARAAEPDREQLLADITAFVAFAPTPDYDDAALAAIRAEPAVAAGAAATTPRGGRGRGHRARRALARAASAPPRARRAEHGAARVRARRRARAVVRPRAQD